MYLRKTFSVFRQLGGRSLRVTNGYQVPSMIRSLSSATNTSVEEPQSQEKGVGDEKKSMKGPFVKNFFVGICDSDVLDYPEYPSLEHLRELDTSTTPVEDHFLNCVDSQKIDETKKIPDDTLKVIKEHNMYGLQVPKQLGGWDVDYKSLARYFESIGCDSSVVTSLNSYYRALNALLFFGTEEQREKLVKEITSGKINVAVCITERPSILSLSDIDTTALPSDNCWKINGEKIWVTEGDKADYFLVFAKTWQGQLKDALHSELSLFLVPKNSPGVECSDNIDQLGTRGVGLCNVKFNNVTVPKENVIGEIGKGAEIALTCLSKGRLGAAAAAVGYLKNLFNTVSEYAIQTKVEGKPLYSMEYYQKQLGAMAVDIYALESMVYFTAGLNDTYDNPDLAVEEAIVKIFSMEKIVEIVDICSNIVGSSAYIKGSLFERSIRDARSYLLHDIVPINVSKIHVATLCLHHAGSIIENEVKKARNPFNFPSFAIKNFFNDHKALDDEIKIPELIRLNLHPSMTGDADNLERSIVRLEYIVKNLFTRWGIEIVDRHMDLIKLTDSIIAMYGMATVLSRASRAYCIGLSNSNFDMAAANVFCGIKSKEIKNLFEHMFNGPMETYDTPCIKIGEHVAKEKGYYFSHPLTRNY